MPPGHKTLIFLPPPFFVCIICALRCAIVICMQIIRDCIYLQIFFYLNHIKIYILPFLQALVDASGSITCPTCRKVTKVGDKNGVAKLQSNFYILNYLMDKYEERSTLSTASSTLPIPYVFNINEDNFYLAIPKICF